MDDSTYWVVKDPRDDTYLDTPAIAGMRGWTDPDNRKAAARFLTRSEARAARAEKVAVWEGYKDLRIVKVTRKKKPKAESRTEHLVRCIALAVQELIDTAREKEES